MVGFVAGGAVLLVGEVFVGAVELLVLVLLELVVEEVLEEDELLLELLELLQSLAAS